MVTKTLYTCQFCNTDYADKEKAMECEKIPYIVLKISNIYYIWYIFYIKMKRTFPMEFWRLRQ